MKRLRAATLAVLALMSVRAHAYFPQWVETVMQRHSGSRKFHLADFNGDGRLDYFTESFVILRVALANADRTLAPAVEIYRGTYVNDTVAADVTGDGKTDLVLADIGTNTITVLASNGDGTFATPIVNALTIAPSSIRGGDFNGDGKLDLAVRSYSSSLLAVYAGDDAGHFAEISRVATAASIYRLDISDIDHDGKQDVLLSNNAPWQHELYFGRGDGTFDAPVIVAAPAATPIGLELVDLDHDDDQEIVSSESTGELRVFRNNGSRSIAAYDTYAVVPPNSSRPVWLATGDFSDDGDPDVAVLLNTNWIVTIEGEGNGSFGSPLYEPISQPDQYTRMTPFSIAAAELTGDDRIDLFLSANVYIGVFANAAGDAELTLERTYPVITAGDEAQFVATLRRPSPPYDWNDQTDAAVPTGLVTFRSGDTILGSAPFVGWPTTTATLDVSGLGIGSHTITAEFPGDDRYRPATAPNTITQRVIVEKTTTTLASSTGGSPIAYGESWSVTAAVTSQLPGDVTGTILVFANGTEVGWPIVAPSDTSYGIWLEPGTYDLHAEYLGSETHPPSRSATVRQVVERTKSTTHFNVVGEYVVAAGQTPTLSVVVSGWGRADGTVHIEDGATRLLTLDVDGQQQFTMPALPVGVHYLRAVYEGSAKHQPSESAILRYVVVPQGFTVVATANAAESSISVRAIYSGQPAPAMYKTYERIANGAFALINTTNTSSMTRYNAESGKVYAYRMEAYDSAGTLLGTSNVDIAMLRTWTDDALRTGMPVKAVHLQELVAQINILRAQGGLAAIAVNDAAKGQIIRKSHIDALRTAIAQGRAAFGANAATIDAVAPNSIIRATHIQQLRDALR